jgi:hypothetical protein
MKHLKFLTYMRPHYIKVYFWLHFFQAIYIVPSSKRLNTCIKIQWANFFCITWSSAFWKVDSVLLWRSHSGDYEVDCFLGCDAVQSQNFYNFQKNVCCLLQQGFQISQAGRDTTVYCFTLKMEAVYSSIMSLNLYQISHCHILEGNILWDDTSFLTEY